MEPLSRDFYARDARAVAIDLIGRRLVRRLVHGAVATTITGTIVEAEAYMGAIDLACHGSRGRMPRTTTMFGPPGHAYVYLIYGVYHCVNAVVGDDGDPSAVLIRGVAIDGVADGTRPHSGSGPPRVARAGAPVTG